MNGGVEEKQFLSGWRRGFYNRAIKAGARVAGFLLLLTGFFHAPPVLLNQTDLEITVKWPGLEEAHAQVLEHGSQILDSSRSATLGGPLCRTDTPAAVSVSTGTSVILVLAAVADVAIKDTQTIRYREVGTAGWINLSTVSSPLRTTASTVLANGQTDVTLSEAVIAANTGSVCNVDGFDGGVYINGIEIENSDANWFAADPDWELAGSDFTENHIAIVDDGSLGADTTFEFQWRQVDDGSNLFIGNRRLSYTVAPPTTTTTSTTSTTSTTAGGPTSSTTTSTTSTTTSTTLIGPAQTTIGTGVDPISVSVLPGETNRAVDAFTVFTNTGTDTITFITFTFQGSVDGDKDVDSVKIYRDDGSTLSEYDAGDTLIATDVFSSGIAEFSGLNIPVTTTPVQYLVTFDIVADPVEGNALEGAVTAAAAGNPVVINDSGNTTLVVSFGASTVLDDGLSPANKYGFAGDTNLAVNAFVLATTAGADNATALTVTGTNTANVAAGGVKIYRDGGGTPREWDGGDTLIATASFSGSTANFGGLSIPITTTPTQYLVTYDMAGSVTDGETMSGVVSAATVGNALTNTDSVDALITATIPKTLVGDGSSPGNKASFPGDLNLAVDSFTLVTNRGSDNVTGITVTGTLTGNVANGGVKIYRDGGGSPNEFDGGDTLVVSGSFSGSTVSFGGLSIPVTTTPVNFIVGYDLASGATPGDALTGFVSSVNANSNPVINNDNPDATITVASPDSVAAPGNLTIFQEPSNPEGQLNIAWTDNSPDEISFSLERAPNPGNDACASLPMVNYGLVSPGELIPPNNPIPRDTVQSVSTGGWVYAANMALVPGTIYCYRVKASSKTASSPYHYSGPAATAPAGPDGTPPSAVNDLVVAAGSQRKNSVDLKWTAPGDDGMGGRALRYDIRFSMRPIVDGGAGPDQVNWDDTACADLLIPIDCTVPVINLPAPKEGGSFESRMIAGRFNPSDLCDSGADPALQGIPCLLPNTVYYFSLKTEDDAGLVSGLSNLAGGDHLTDGTLPGRTALRPNFNLVTVPAEISGANDSPGAVFGDDVGGVPALLRWNSSGIGENDGCFEAFPLYGSDCLPPVEITAVTPGAGYFIMGGGSNPVLDAPAGSAPVPTGTHCGTPNSTAVALDPQGGWNIVGNPFGTAVELGSVRVCRNGQTASFVDAANQGWVNAGVFRFNGSTYTPMTGADGPFARFEPWRAYWIQVLLTDGSVSDLVFPAP